MSYTPETPFESIEGAQQYVELLLETIEDAQREVDLDMTAADATDQARRLQALRLVAHNLNRLSFHITRSRRLLNDLRTLRRLLLEERLAAERKEAAKAAGAA